MSDAMRNSANTPGFLPDEDGSIRKFEDRNPVGTLAEVRESYPNLRPGQVVVCGPTEKHLGVDGCPAWSHCPFVDLKGRSGPELGAFEYIRPASSASGFTYHVSVIPCFHYPFEKRRMRLNGGACKHKAWGGAEVNVPGSRIVDTITPGQGTVRTHVPGIIKITIPKYVRPKENLELAKFAMIQDALMEDQEVAADLSEASMLRIAAGVKNAPMDPAEVIRREQQNAAGGDDNETDNEIIEGTSGDGIKLELEREAPADRSGSKPDPERGSGGRGGQKRG